MAYTAQTLITKAYYLSGIVSRELQTVSGSQIQNGLDLLNALLDSKGSDLRLIPYFTKTSFNTVAGQDTYFIPNLVDIDVIAFDNQSIRFSMERQSRYEFFGTPRALNIQSLPNAYRSERILGGMNVYLYYVPNQVYPVNYWGKFALTDVALGTDLSTTFDLYYINYLRYALAEYICEDYGISFLPETKAKLEEIRKKLMDVSPKDLRIRKGSYFGYGPALNYAIVNISGGYVP